LGHIFSVKWTEKLTWNILLNGTDFLEHLRVPLSDIKQIIRKENNTRRENTASIPMGKIANKTV